MANSPGIPILWDAKERLQKPDLSKLTRLLFLTTTDFAPFNYLDSSGRLSGFHVDLARAICAELGVTEKCQIQAMPFAELEATLKQGQGEAILAGLSVTSDSRAKFDFSRSYLVFPARFVTLEASALSEPFDRSIAGRRVGVKQGTAHETMLRAYFPEAKTVAYESAESMFKALKAGTLDAVFGDGMQLSFWLAGPDAGQCCRFAGGPYIAPEHLGGGLAIATAKDDPSLTRAFDHALQQISAKGIFAEIYLRYFPISFF
ncbi:transporter substrate-binding domain-containing protein [Mesorhizobium sp. NBSH29]|uniref:transporter substrate-binding domain-containing protein n=1 Tax=Mesorhizobium sp. NBSH29 TaxID=2654249 RepID=UPI0021562F84|nr:transporter substrate-binding domain-containing protein [Mesorhizobium sp. NBSH29]